MTTTGKPPNPGRGLRIWFLLAYLAGAAVIGASMVLPLDLYGLIGLPLAVMLIYVLGFFLRRRPAYLVEAFGDSVFYLGFLLTATALLASLLPYALEVSQPSLEAILAKFGVALTTTLFGLIARVTFRQFAMTPDQADGAAQESFFDQAQAFSRQLEALIGQFRGTAEALNADLAETVNASVSGIEAAGKAGIAELGDTAAAARQTIDHSATAIVDRLEGEMQQAFHRSRTSVDAFGQSMEALRDTTARTLEPFSAEMTDMVAELRNVREASARNEERIARIFKSYEMMIGKLREAQEHGDRFQERLGTRLSDLITALEGASRTIETLTGDTHAVVGGLGSEIEGVRQAKAALEADAAAIAEIRQQLGDELNAAVDIAAVNRSVGEAAGPIADTLSIDDDAFSDPNPPADPDEVHIPPLHGRHRRLRGPA